MNRSEYIKQRTAIDEAEKEIALELIHEHFPDVELTSRSRVKLWSGTIVRIHPDLADNAPAGGGLYEVNILTGTVLYVGPDFAKMATAAMENPTNYTVEQRGETVVFIVWRGSEAAINRFEAGIHTGHVDFRRCQEDENGTFIKQGSRKVYRNGEGV